jgi:hypothetical protein
VSSPAVAREQPAERSQEGAVDGPVRDAAADLALKDSHLVMEDHERQYPAQPEVQEREGHSP